MQLSWSKRPNNTWFRLEELDFRALEQHGVYIIWHGGFPSRVVRVGHGLLGAELYAARDDIRVRDFVRFGPLYVTWAVVAPAGAAGVRRHLADRLRPLIEDSDPQGVVALAANSPF
jgi:hypothetical protein